MNRTAARPSPAAKSAHDSADETTALIFDVQRLSIHDGPGIRTTVFFKGCPLSCRWCHNPESIAPEPQPMFDRTRCIHCGACLHSDATRAAESCPTGARRLAGRRVDLPALLAELLRDRPFYTAGGGVTFGGGEPLLQWPAVRALARALRREGVHTVIDTSGFAGEDIQRALPEEVDMAIVDLKAMDDAAHRRWTGQSNVPILRGIRRWSGSMPGRLWITLPLIPGVHDEAAVRATAAFLVTLPNNVPVRVVEYNRFGESKCEQLGLPVPRFDGDPAALAEFARLTLQDAGITVLAEL